MAKKAYTNAQVRLRSNNVTPKNSNSSGSSSSSSGSGKSSSSGSTSKKKNSSTSNSNDNKITYTKKVHKDYSQEETEKLLKTKISSGYTKEEIENIISKATPYYQGVSTKELSKQRPTHKNTHEYVYDEYIKAYTNPECYFEVNGQPLRIKTQFNAERDVQVNETRLFSGFNTADKAALKHLYFQGDAGITLNVEALVFTDDAYIGEKAGDLVNYTEDTTVASVLIDWNRTFQACKIISDSPIIEKGYYRMTRCNPTQIHHNLIHFELTFVQDTYNFNPELQTKGALSTVNNNIKTGSSNHRYDSSELEVPKDNTKPVTPKTNIQTDTTKKPVENEFTKKLKDCVTLKKKCKCTTYKRSDCSTKTRIECVVQYQKALQKVGYYLGYKVDGLFCCYTYQATRKFQQDNKLVVDGWVGTQTMTALIKKLEAL